MLAQERDLLPDVKAAVEAPTEEEIALLLVDDDEAMLTLVLGSTDVALPIVVVVEMQLLFSCDAVRTDQVVETANVTLVDDFADVVEADEDVLVDMLTVVLGPQDALATDTAELDCRDELALGCVDTVTD